VTGKLRTRLAPPVTNILRTRLAPPVTGILSNLSLPPVAGTPSNRPLPPPRRGAGSQPGRPQGPPRLIGARFSLPALLLFPLLLFAGQTKTWSEGVYSDFEKGILHNLSLRSDGLLTLAPVLKELYDTSSPYLWALARDSKGNLYTGGGANARIYQIPPGGKGKLLAELDALQVQALAVDARDRVYAAVSPDAKVYRLSASGKPELFYDPKAKYIWALRFDSHGDLLVATGDPGGIHRVAPDGKGILFFPCQETHVRSMTLDAAGNLIVGTDPGGLLLRVSPAGQGFVLYQLPRREVTAVAVAKDGSIYAAGVGNKTAPSTAPSSLPPPPSVAPLTVTVNAPGGPPAAGAPRSAPAPPASLSPLNAVAGGSEVYSIAPNGAPQKIWSHAQDVVYALAFDADGRLLLATGNKGAVYRIESPSLFTALLTVPATQVTAFLPAPGGRLYAAAGNVGKVYAIGPGPETEGTIESDVFDASLFSLWGRLSFEANLNGGHVALQTRSGNLDQPQNNWSPWSAPIAATEGARVDSPPSRFVQWKATLKGDGGSRSPELESVDLAYLPNNVAPRVDEIEITAPNYKFPPPAAPGSSTPPNLTLPPLGRAGSSGSPSFSVDSATTTPAMPYAKGQRGARWVATDPNGDTMIYTVEIRGLKETRWKPLKDKVAEKYFSFDATAFPDGEYRLRITASDAPANPPAEALTGSLVSEPFTIDNTPPKITALTANRSGGNGASGASGAKLRLRWHAADALSTIAKAEYSLDGGDWTLAAPVTKLSDSLDLDYDLTVDAAPGEHTIAVRVTDDCDNQSSEKVVAQ